MTRRSNEKRGNEKVALRVNALGKRFLISSRARRENFLSIARRLLTGGSESRELWALRGLSFELERGEILGIIGPNGAGKSTLLLLLADILGPTEGTLEVHGRTTQFFQLASGLQDRLTVIENFTICAALLGFPRKRLRKLLPAIIEFSGLKDYLHAKYGELSTGLAARVAFSTAIYADLDIILIDEVLSVGDAAFQAKCQATFLDFRKQGKTMVVVSHSLDMILKLCTQVLYLNQGEMIYMGPPKNAIRRLERDAGLSSRPSKS